MKAVVDARITTDATLADGGGAYAETAPAPAATNASARRLAAVASLFRARMWTPAYDGDGKVRDGAWVTELTGILDLATWPPGMRVIVRAGCLERCWWEGVIP